MPGQCHLTRHCSGRAFASRTGAGSLLATSVQQGAHLANTFAIGSVGTFALFYVGVLLYIVSGAIQFLLVLVVRPAD